MLFKRPGFMCLCFCAYLLAVSVPACVAAVYDEMIVRADNESGIQSKPLQNGVLYTFIVSGVCSNWNDEGYFDAEWQTQRYSADWEEVDSTPPGEWNYQRDVLDLLIDDTAVDWWGSADGTNWAPHTYSPFHVYLYQFRGTGAPVLFRISDPTPFEDGSWYDNNYGYLSIAIMDTPVVPEPSSIFALFSGLGFLAVKFRGRGK